jgi:hypothetical protein
MISKNPLVPIIVCVLLFVCLEGCDRSTTSNVAWLASECGDEGEEEVDLCLDGDDGDGDGLLDCEDPDCAAFCIENTKARCMDGVDNDQDGLTDCRDDECQKPGLCCPEVPSVEELGAEACSDGVDNDCNGYLDCDDWSCAPEAFCEGSDATCSDGIDNDSDGFTDCADYSCSQSNTVSVCAD